MTGTFFKILEQNSAEALENNVSSYLDSLENTFPDGRIDIDHLQYSTTERRYSVAMLTTITIKGEADEQKNRP